MARVVKEEEAKFNDQKSKLEKWLKELGTLNSSHTRQLVKDINKHIAQGYAIMKIGGSCEKLIGEELQQLLPKKLATFKSSCARKLEEQLKGMEKDDSNYGHVCQRAMAFIDLTLLKQELQKVKNNENELAKIEQYLQKIERAALNERFEVTVHLNQFSEFKQEVERRIQQCPIEKKQRNGNFLSRGLMEKLVPLGKQKKTQPSNTEPTKLQDQTQLSDTEPQTMTPELKSDLKLLLRRLPSKKCAQLKKVIQNAIERGQQIDTSTLDDYRAGVHQSTQLVQFETDLKKWKNDTEKENLMNKVRETTEQVMSDAVLGKPMGRDQFRELMSELQQQKIQLTPKFSFSRLFGRERI
jgi:hypothetical protein